MSEEQNDDKQFEATEQKLRKAREKGDFPRSTEVNAALAYLGALVGGAVIIDWLLPAWMLASTGVWSDVGSTRAPDGRTTTGYDLDMAMRVWGSAAIYTLAAIAIPAAVVLIGLVVQRGVVFVPSKLSVDMSRINPVKNAGQKFGKTALVTFAISVCKVAAVGLGGWLLFRTMLAELLATGAAKGWLTGLRAVIENALLLSLVISAVFAIADLGWKHLDFRRRNRMSMKEMKDEMKESDGDPHMKSARRQKSMEIVMSSMLADVERADVVIVNPTHYAVALTWKRGSGKAPVCVAKGTDAVAARIRQRAAEHDVPVWSDPLCARAIHASVDIGAEIEPDHFAAVAAAIRFAETMREKVKRGW
ncbi:flagellar type III secretion system protein FlhB [Paracoccus albus]|uniref:flagellar type III secretion system protein FlhB n=1 Tax=Paracoccus albus TaxID=3017784 RepID=UPI0022F0316D|nr:flagellar type III secretion system protein FlhB [Paracoccus albus]WBU60215.1 flagellar type III secretion system protein FlhB [Paracoccus albus]